MAPHGHALPQTKKNGGIGVKPKNIVTYQIGVDILGFPIYMEHHIIKVVRRDAKPEINRPTKYGQIVDAKIIKQH